MAHLLRRPLCIALGLSTRTPIPRRCFSHSPSLLVAAQSHEMLRNKTRAEKSIKVLQKQNKNVPSDIGLLPETFIAPTLSKSPSIFRSPRRALRFQWKRLRTRGRDLFSLIVLKYMGPGGWMNRPIKLSRSTLVPTALALHKQMYSAFAEGDVKTLREICADGLYESFSARIGNRPKGEKVKWELVRYKGNGRVMSNRAGRLPIEGAAVRQVVVRVRSVQTLTRWRNGKQVEGSGVEKEVEEFVVLQRRLINWQEQDWQIWGTTQETGAKEVEGWSAQED